MKKEDAHFTVLYQNRSFKILITPDFLIGMEQGSFNPDFNLKNFMGNAGTDFMIKRKDIQDIRFESSNPWLMGHNQLNEKLWIDTPSLRWKFIVLDPTSKIVAEQIKSKY